VSVATATDGTVPLAHVSGAAAAAIAAIVDVSGGRSHEVRDACGGECRRRVASLPNVPRRAPPPLPPPL
jgi:hypothetical protein